MLKELIFIRQEYNISKQYGFIKGRFELALNIMKKLERIKYKKAAIDILVILLAFVLFALWYQSNIKKTGQSVISLIKYDTVYLITTGEKYKYWEYINQGAADMAEISGVNYIWSIPTDRAPDSQIEKINEAVDKGASAILIAADNPRRISGVVEDAKARGVKIIYVDAPANEEAIVTLATDNYEAGKAAGRSMLRELEKKGIGSGSIGVVTVEGKQNAVLRDDGFREIIKEDGKFKLLDTVVTSGETEAAKRAAATLIRENPDLVGLFGTNEGTSEGVGFAIQEDKDRIVGIGIDKSDVTVQLFNEGSLKNVIIQNPYSMGYLGMSEAIAAILGKDTGPGYIDTGFSELKAESR